TCRLETSIPTPNGGDGLVITPSHKAFTSHGVVVDLLTGNILAQITNPGADQIWYNVGDNRVYFGVTGTAPVVDADTNKFLVNLPSAAGHTLAVDPNNNHIFAPVTGAGIKVFAAQ